MSQPGEAVIATDPVRSSGMLLLGRCIAALLTALAQVPLIRYLSQSDYGAFAYALSIVTILQPFATLGLQRTVSRFVPIYHERGEYGKLLGTISLLLLTILIILAILPFAVHRSDLLARFVHDPLPRTLIVVLIFLLPTESLNDVAISLFASFGGAREIFFRVHILGPLLRLAVIIVMIVARSDVGHLAIGYLAASIIGVATFCWMLVRKLRQLKILSTEHWHRLSIPAGEMFSFALPLLFSELVTGTVMNAVALLLLGYYCDMTQVAVYRAAMPLARLNLLVMTTFSVLYTPAASRLFARAEFASLNRLYWRTTLWITVLSFPCFIATFSVAKPVVQFLFGSRYAGSATILMLLSASFYFNVALGFNVLTLRVFGKLRSILAINAVAAAVDIVISLLLVPRYGAFGAAAGSAVTMVLLNALTQVALRTLPGLKVLDPDHLRVSSFLFGIAFALLLVIVPFHLNIYAALPLAILTSLFALSFARRHLDLTETFPEVSRFVWIRRFFQPVERIPA